MALQGGTQIGPYQIIESLGTGGMGTVYRAHDPRLGRDVALKVLSPECAVDSALVARFDQEARAAGALNHPNILSVLDVGAQEQVHFLVSELLEGETLRQRLRSGPLPVPEAVGIAIQILHGLAVAHEKGVLHRDLKPENLFLTREGTVKILDFGLAKLRGDGMATSTGTEPGTLVGSVGYMSPEQVNGLEVDQRADLFAIGVVLHEMLSGTRPFQGSSVVAVLNAILHDRPPDLTSLGAGISPQLAQVVERCLEKDRARRFQSARDLAFQLQTATAPPAPEPQGMSFLQELKRRRVFRALVGYGIAAFAILQIIEPVMHGLHWREEVLSYSVVALGLGFPLVVALAWIFDVNQGRVERTAPGPLRGLRAALLVVGIGLLAAAPGVIWHFLLRPNVPPQPAGEAAASIAVLPFVNLSGDKQDEYFSDGVTEEIINKLANLEGLRVVARTSAFSFKGKSLNVRQIGQELNVSTILEGSVRREGNRVRIVAQLIGAAEGYHLWSKTWDRELGNVFSLEDELAHAIAQALEPRLVQRNARVETTSSTEAHDLYLKGRYFLNQRTREGLAKAAQMFEQAISLDPRYALAHSGLSDCYSLDIQYGGADSAEALPKAKAHALKALELDDRLAEAHASLGIVSRDYYDHDASVRELKRAIELRPGYATAHHWYALTLLGLRRLADSRTEAEQARRLDPASASINTVTGIVSFNSRDYERAIEQLTKALELDPNFDVARLWLVYSYLQSGAVAKALAAVDAAKRPSNALSGARAHVLAAAGDALGAQRLLADVEKRFAAEPLPRGVLAAAHLALGDEAGAFAWLEKAVETRDQSLIGVQVNPIWDHIRPDPRFHSLLRRMNLE